ncbi:putative ribonuclease H-like domain-containing protein [Tanacetum coccineum]|uniref:Ribonuclease H-like domain-containing protein n=1 Tax=Tanacetum coccineum TaxID=301880 RepID=A0ABQ4XBT1_9ASTR
MPPKHDLSFSGLEEFLNEPIVSEPTVKKPVVETSEAKANANKPKAVRKNNGALIIRDWVSDSEEEDVPQSMTQKKTVKPSFAKIEFVKSKEQVKPPRKTTVKQGNQNRLNTHSPRGNQRNWNNMMSQRLRVNTIKDKNVNAARPKAVVSAVRPKAVLNAFKRNRVNAVKASACCVWKPKTKQDLQEKGVIDSGCLRHMTGNMSYLTDFKEIDGGYVAFGGNPKGGKIISRGTIKTGNLDFKNMYFIRELKFNLFSVSQMCDKKNSVLFNDTECIVLSPNFKLTDESHVLLKVPRKNNMYSVDLKNIVPKGSLTCLFAKATSDESKLWHRRLGHINFKTMNKLVKGNLVRGLPSKLFENNQTCVACQKGKQHRASCKSKTVSSISQPLHMLHMDLFGPTFVKSLMKKMYCLVVTDDYSRFSWVFFLATKDETSGILKSFITGVENLIDQRVKVIRTPQQNGVAERKNRTLIEAARTMLADSKLPTTFWAEAVNIACYVQNEVLVTKPHNKTPYELFLGRKLALGFMRPFGCPVTILNTIYHLGKFDGKADEGFFVGYSINSKAFRVFNNRTRIVEENLHVQLNGIGVNAGDSKLMLLCINLLLLGKVNATRHKLTAAGEIVFLAKPAESEGFEQIVDFLNAHTIKYALTVNPTIYTLCIEQFWATAKVKIVNGEVQLQALGDGKKIIVTEASVRRDLQLNDEEGTDCLPNATIFEELTRMGYEKLSQKLTFYKAIFSPKWKFLIHTILQCLSAKTTAWNEFSSTMASAIICLATNQNFNFSKYIFESMVKNLDNAGKFLMYPRFVQVFLDKQLEGYNNPQFSSM